MSLAASTELLRQQVHGHELSDLLFNAELPLALPPEVGQRVAAPLGSLTLWDEQEGWPGLEVRIGGAEPVLGRGLLAHARTEAGVATGVPAAARSAARAAGSRDGRAVHAGPLRGGRGVAPFFRHVLEVERVDERVWKRSPSTPSRTSAMAVWRGLGELEGGYARVREALHQVLGVLDDHGAWVFTDETGRLSRSDPAPSGANPSP